jgi:hypothetical protein
MVGPDEVSAVDAVKGGAYPHKSMSGRVRTEITPGRLQAGRIPEYSEILSRAGCGFLMVLTVYYGVAMLGAGTGLHLVINP